MKREVDNGCAREADAKARVLAEEARCGARIVHVRIT
jgi:hypothetical protein